MNRANDGLQVKQMLDRRRRAAQNILDKEKK